MKSPAIARSAVSASALRRASRRESELTDMIASAVAWSTSALSSALWSWVSEIKGTPLAS